MKNTYIRSIPQLSVWQSGPISGHLFSRILSLTKATFQSTEQSSPFVHTAGPTWLGACPPQLISPQYAVWYSMWAVTSNGSHHSIKLRHVHIKPERDLASNWIPSDIWLPSLISLWISTCTSNVTEHTLHEVTRFHFCLCHWDSRLSHHALYPLIMPPGTGGSLLSHGNPSSIWKTILTSFDNTPPVLLFQVKHFLTTSKI